MIFTHSDEPLSVTLLLFPGLSLMSLAATLDPAARRQSRARAPGLSLEAGLDRRRDAVASCGLPIPVDGAFDPAESQDALVVIAAF